MCLLVQNGHFAVSEEVAEQLGAMFHAVGAETVALAHGSQYWFTLYTVGIDEGLGLIEEIMCAWDYAGGEFLYVKL